MLKCFKPEGLINSGPNLSGTEQSRNALSVIALLKWYTQTSRLVIRRSQVRGSGLAPFFRWDWSWNLFFGHSLPSADSRREVVSYLRKNVHWELVNHLIGLSLLRKSVVRLTDRPDMTLAVDCGRCTTTQHNKNTQTCAKKCIWRYPGQVLD